MSVQGFSKVNHLSELAEPLDTQEGVKTPSVRRAAVLSNLFGDAYQSDAIISPMRESAGVADKLLEVPDVASGGVLAAHVTDAMSHSIRIRSADGTLYYVMATTTVTNRTGGA